MITNGGRLLKRGYTFDPECHRTTHRLRVAGSLLRTLGVEAEWEHGTATTVDFGRVKHACSDACKPVWPEWVSDDVFDLAYKLADEVQDKRGGHNRAAAARAKARA